MGTTGSWSRRAGCFVAYDLRIVYPDRIYDPSRGCKNGTSLRKSPTQTLAVTLHSLSLPLFLSSSALLCGRHTSSRARAHAYEVLNEPRRIERARWGSKKRLSAARCARTDFSRHMLSFASASLSLSPSRLVPCLCLCSHRPGLGLGASDPHSISSHNRYLLARSLLRTQTPLYGVLLGAGATSRA
ncbi:hypothetical protein ZHAS_00016973 [Anopheles sinensis]|uniref:Uncharacterized protein n=1 Tax=Anopheles sinensis TaxID=74873 RepID=A0A084WFH6_ANOSI|nr:hypothetical protein ZHAS_00016973 [Anopheles sinensis]